MLLEGLHLPLITPFYPDGRLYLRKLEHNVDRYSKTPVAGFAVLSEPGEPSLLSDDETRQVLETAIGAAAETKVMLAAVSRDSVRGTLELVETAANLGYDAVLLRRPMVLHPKAVRESITYFRTVADRAPIPLVLYSTASAVPVEVVSELAGHPRILGMVDEGVDARRIEAILRTTAEVKREITVTHVFAAVTGRMSVPKESSAGATFVMADSLTEGGAAVAVAPPKPGIKTRIKTVGFQYLTARTAGMLDGLRAGSVGAMPALAAAAPQACYEVLAAWKDGDLPLAETKVRRLAAAVTHVEGGLGVPGIRYASDLNGYFGGFPRLPLLPLTGVQRQSVETAMAAMRS